MVAINDNGGHIGERIGWLCLTTTTNPALPLLMEGRLRVLKTAQPQSSSHTQITLALPANSHLLPFSKAATEQYFWLGKAFNAGWEMEGPTILLTFDGKELVGRRPRRATTVVGLPQYNCQAPIPPKQPIPSHCLRLGRQRKKQFPFSFPPFPT